METIVFDIAGNKIEWDGAGTYVALRMRGATIYRKLPEGKNPLAGTIIKDFASKPESYIKPKPNNGLWE